MFFDYHTHSIYSDDGYEQIEDIINKAIELGLEEICLTDHVDYGIKQDIEGLSPEEIKTYKAMGYEAVPDPKNKEEFYGWLTYRLGKILNVNYEPYFKELNVLKEKYKDKIAIKKGLEFGIQTITLDKYNKLFDRYKNELDFILLSIHQINNGEFWTQEYFQGKNQIEYNLEYYEQLLSVMKQYKDYSILAHLDLINRYDPLGPIEFEKVKPIITEVLKLAIADKKGIEVNTSSFHYGLKDLTPNRNILKLYHELGGTIITVGSDAHKLEYLGAHIKDIYQELKQIGFEYICTYEAMKPIYHKL